MKKYLGVVCAVGAIALVGFVIALSMFDAGKDSEHTVADEREHWLAVIEDRGPEIAYKLFVDDNHTRDEGVQHVRAHFIGELLYESIGIRGIGVCDVSFGFGCFHGFFTRGFAQEGEMFVKEADEMCLIRFGPLGTGCQHGIGHGIVEYVGHDDIAQALALCEHTTQPAMLLGCPSGVFMERFTPFTVIPGQEPHPPLAFSEEQPYGLCESVDEEFQPVCFFELGGWWEVVLTHDVERMGSLCEAVEDATLQEVCLMGVGKIIGHTHNYDITKSVEACNIASAKSSACHAGVAWSMFSNPKYAHKAVAVCEELEVPGDVDSCRLLTNVTEY